MRRLARFVRLHPADRRLIVETAVLVVVVWLFQRARRERFLAALRSGTCTPTEVQRAPATETRVRWALSAVGRSLPLARNCLVRAVVAQVLLRRRGVPSKLMVGVARDRSHGLRAHAWLEGTTGAVVGGDQASEFTPLAYRGGTRP